jgi:hypothetical protein|tara:strand:- start:765 stop:1109 length:345 start_codon:yes stop_codon:yes gene_type:complete
LDKDDKSNLHVEMDTILTHLVDYGIPVPPKQYEIAAIDMLKNEVVNKLKMGERNSIEYIAEMLIVLGSNILQAAEISARTNMVSETDDISKKLEEARAGWDKRAKEQEKSDFLP